MADHRLAGDRDVERRHRLRERLRAGWIAGAEGNGASGPGGR
jgi:hypothetical protein